MYSTASKPAMFNNHIFDSLVECKSRRESSWQKVRGDRQQNQVSDEQVSSRVVTTIVVIVVNTYGILLSDL